MAWKFQFDNFLKWNQLVVQQFRTVHMVFEICCFHLNYLVMVLSVCFEKNSNEGYWGVELSETHCMFDLAEQAVYILYSWMRRDWMLPIYCFDVLVSVHKLNNCLQDTLVLVLRHTAITPSLKGGSIQGHSQLAQTRLRSRLHCILFLHCGQLNCIKSTFFYKKNNQHQLSEVLWHSQGQTRQYTLLQTPCLVSLLPS